MMDMILVKQNVKYLPVYFCKGKWTVKENGI